MYLRRSRVICLLLILLLIRRRRRKLRQRRLYMRGINSKRRIHGEFYSLVLPMRDCYPDDHFNYFRMTKDRFDHLLSKIEPKLFRPATHRIPISAMERLAITLRYFASGDSFSSLAFSYRVGRSTITAIIQETAVAIWDALNVEYLALPKREDWRRIATEFYTNWQFPLCVGCIDGKHIAIKKPAKSSSDYYNYKGFFSVVLLAVVDANYNFILVNIGGYGRQGDAAIFNRWSFSERLQSATESYENGGLSLPYDACLPGSNIRMPHVFLGDQAFGLKRHLMRPYAFNRAGNSEHAFNYRLSRARRVVENSFGILSTRWRVLEKRIDINDATVDHVIKACVVLHNYLKATDATDHIAPKYIPPNYVDYENEQGQIVMGGWRNNVDRRECLHPMPAWTQSKSSEYAIRERFKAFFQSPEGILPWQAEILCRTS